MLAQSVDDRWRDSRADLPLDHDGPTDVVFEKFDDVWVERPIVDRFNQIVARYGDKTAVVDEITQLTYRELQRASFHLACRIEALVPAGQPVGILLPNNALFPLAALACLAVGRPYVPIDPQYPRTRIDQIRQDAGLSVMIITRVEGQVFDGAGSLPCLDIGTSLDGADERVPSVAASGGPAVILYTSGSTGGPKGICNDQRAILQRVAQATNSCHLNANDRFFLLSPPGTIAGVRETFAALLNGATLYVADPTRLGINSVLRMLRDARATVGYTVPALLRQLLAAPDAKEALGHARIVRIGGDILVADDLALCRAVLPSSCKILIAFSSTEVPTIFQWFVPRDWDPDGTRLPIGYARPGMTFRIEDNDAAAEAGELVVKSRYLALGYWQGGRLQSGPLQADPADSSARILRTGDRVRLRPDGLAEMAGRVDRQVKVHGSRVDLAEVEAILHGCDGVADAAVIARRQGEDVTAIVAYVVPCDPPSATFANNLKDALAKRLLWRMRPAQYHILEALPRLRGFKTDLKALERLDQHEFAGLEAAASAEKAFSPTIVPTAKSGDSRVHDAVARAWAAVVNRQSFDANMAWDEAGGDSLGALHLWSRIEEELGTRLVIESLELNATPTKLIAAVERQLCSPPLSSTPAANSPRAPLVYFFPSADGDTPMQAEFREAFHNQIRFAIVKYPQWREFIDAGADFGVLIEAAVNQILATSGDDIYLAGYSYGGFVAWEVARRLIELNRRVDFVGLIDTQPEFQLSPFRLEKLGTIIRSICLWPPYIVVMLLAVLAKTSAFRVLRAFGQLVAHLPATIRFKLYYSLNYWLRAEAMYRWRLKPAQAPIYLFQTDDFLPTAAKSAWDALTSRLEVITVGGRHLSILRPPERESLCRQFLRVVNAVERANKPGDQA